MKSGISVLIFLAACLTLSAQKPGALIDVQSYRFDIELSDGQDIIRCTASVSIRFLKDTDKFSLDLVSRKSNGKGMIVDEVRYANGPLKFQHEKDILTLDLASKAGDEKTIQIVYHGIPADGLIISKNKYQQRTFFSDNWPNRARNWLACVDHPSDKATVEFAVTAPTHYQVVANGEMLEESNLELNRKLTHWRESVAISTKIMVIGVADFAVNYSGKVDCIPVYAWVYPQDKLKGFHDFALATEVLPYFIKNIGPYAFEKLANVQSKTIFGGMENAGAIFYAENLVDGKRTAEPTIVHEIAHQWFGDMATETDWPHLWLSEGFATYMTMLYMEQKYGKDTLNRLMAEDRRQVIKFSKENNRPVVDTTVSDYMQLLNANSYQKGGWVLHMLRHELGDESFWNAVRNYYSNYAGKNANTEDLKKEFEKVSGRDLTGFFRQWLFTAGQPDLEVMWKYDKRKELLNISITQKQSTVFRFSLDILIVSDTGVRKETIMINAKQTDVSFKAKNQPLQIKTDPDTKLLFEVELKNR
jgi:aminopeptidase N